jgi:antitoxin component of RelBE/YafQ-DinJ toxin-antitoxin module
VNRYSKIPKNIRFDQDLLELAEQYQRQKGINFSDLVRLSLGTFLKRKLYDID